MPVATALPENPLAVDANILTAWRHKENKLQQSIKDYIIRFKTPPALPSFVAFEALDGFESGISKAGETTELMQKDLTATKQLIHSCRSLPFNGDAAEGIAHFEPFFNWK